MDVARVGASASVASEQLATAKGALARLDLDRVANPVNAEALRDSVRATASARTALTDAARGAGRTGTGIAGMADALLGAERSLNLALDDVVLGGTRGTMLQDVRAGWAALDDASTSLARSGLADLAHAGGGMSRPLAIGLALGTVGAIGLGYAATR